MKDKENYWIIQVLRGVFSTHGPFRTSQGAENHYKRVSGGDVYLWRSWLGEGSEREVVEEFKTGQFSKEGNW